MIAAPQRIKALVPPVQSLPMSLKLLSAQLNSPPRQPLYLLALLTISDGIFLQLCKKKSKSGRTQKQHSCSQKLLLIFIFVIFHKTRHDFRLPNYLKVDCSAEVTFLLSVSASVANLCTSHHKFCSWQLSLEGGRSSIVLMQINNNTKSYFWNKNPKFQHKFHNDTTIMTTTRLLSTKQIPNYEIDTIFRLKNPSDR